MNRIPVVYASDNNYVLPTIVSITSLLVNKDKDTFYSIFVLDSGITAENKEKFFWEQNKNEYELEFISISLKEFDETKSYGTWVPTIYAKYFICDLLDTSEKCIWLDSDTIIQSDLTELYNIDVSNRYLGAVKSPGTNYNVAAEKHLILMRDTYNLKCINVGVLLLNLSALRKIGGGAYFLKETLHTVSLFPPNTPVTEQDMFNKLLSDNMVYLPLKYNFYINNMLNFYERHYYPFCFSRAVIEEAFSRPVIIHYALPEKPWLYSNAKAVYGWLYTFSVAVWHNYYAKSPLGIHKLKQKRISLISIMWYHLKPILKKNRVLIKIKRYFTKTVFESPIHDFFD